MPFSSEKGVEVMTIQWVGDLSIEDAKILQEVADKKNIVEFGCGGSTLIFAQSGANSIFSVETDAEWIALTKERLNVLAQAASVNFVPYDFYKPENADIVFVDGVDHLRLDFAIKMWPYLSQDGIMLFHDTKRFKDFQNAAWIMQMYHNEIRTIDVNHQNSNLTLIHKKPHAPYVNWNETEGKPQWAYGIPQDMERTRLWPIEN